MSQRRNGFTLVEVVIAIGILGVMLAIGYGTLRNILVSKQLLDDGRDARLVADAVVGRMSRELQLAFEGTALLPPRSNMNQPYSSRISLIGEAESIDADAKADSITFLALEGGQYLPDGGTHSGIVQVSYRMVETPPEQAVGDSKYSLVREEVPYIRPAKRAYRRSVVFPITDRIESLQFMYLDDNKDEWVDSWGSAGREGLPGQVWFSITLKSGTGKISTYATTIPMRHEE